MTPEIERLKHDLFDMVAEIGPRQTAFLRRCFRSLRPSEDEPEVKDARRNREARRMLAECLSKPPGTDATPPDGKGE